MNKGDDGEENDVQEICGTVQHIQGLNCALYCGWDRILSNKVALGVFDPVNDTVLDGLVLVLLQCESRDMT